MEENSILKKIIKRNVLFFILVLFIALIGLIILKYHVEGEQNMPFDLSEILVVSTAEGNQKEETGDNNWNVDIYQTNDVYLNIKKNKNYKDTEIIKNIEIKNINIDEKPSIGKIELYVPSNENEIYNYEENYKINSNIVFEGDKKSDIKNLKISNQGGTIVFRIVNKTGKEYISNDEELKHDGTLLQKAEVNNEDIKAKISFDIVITLESGVSFSGKITLEIPVDDVTTQGVTNLDKKDMKDVVFKRQ